MPKVSSLYQLIDIKDSTRKNNLHNKFKLEYQMIDNEYLNELHNLNNEYIDPYLIEDSILFLPSAFSCTEFWANKYTIEINDDVIFTKNIITMLEKKYPKHNVYLKPHPRTSLELFTEYNNTFPNYIISEKIFDYPAEAICINPKINIVVSSLFSSTLLYSKYLLNKKVYFIDVPKKTETLFQNNQLITVKKKLKELGISEIALNA